MTTKNEKPDPTPQEIRAACAGQPPAVELAKNVPTGEQMQEANAKAAKGKAGFNHPMLQGTTYEKCPVCKGTRVTVNPAMVDGVPRKGGGSYSGPLPVGSPCPCCHDGYVETGLTVGQVERIRAERDLLLTYVVKVADSDPTNCTPLVTLTAIVECAREDLKLITGSDVSRTRNEIRAEEMRRNCAKHS